MPEERKERKENTLFRLTFRDSYDVERPLGDFPSREAAFKEISNFLAERGFKSFYMRLWDVEEDGKKRTQIDVGSWSEFFFLEEVERVS